MTTTAQLIADRSCSAACIAATTAPSRCKCPCRGEFHSLVATADVTALVEARRAGRHRLTDIDLIEGIE